MGSACSCAEDTETQGHQDGGTGVNLDTHSLSCAAHSCEGCNITMKTATPPLHPSFSLMGGIAFTGISDRLGSLCFPLSFFLLLEWLVGCKVTTFSCLAHLQSGRKHATASSLGQGRVREVLNPSPDALLHAPALARQTAPLQNSRITEAGPSTPQVGQALRARRS